MGPRAITVAIVVAMCISFARAAQDPEAIDWGAWRVKVEEHWPGAEAGWDWGKGPRAGIGLSRQMPGTLGANLDYKMGWTADGDEGASVTGMLEGQLAMEERLEVVSFGRRGSEIGLVMVVHPTGGVLPESVKDVVRRRMGAAEQSRVAVSFEDARSASLGGKKVLFAGAFPEDLPVGEYQIVAELRDETGRVKQHYERHLLKREKAADPLQSLSDEQLLQEYVRRGEAMKGTGVEPVDSRSGRIAAAYPYFSPASTAWTATHYEIVKRDKQMVPALMTMLEAEAVRNPGETSIMSERFGFAFDVMRMLAEIGDPRPVPLLVRIMEGMDGQANLPVRMQAIETAGRLTYTTFLVERDNPVVPWAMMHEWALVTSWQEQTAQTRVANVKQVAGLYSKWLNGEGRDAAQWLPLAQQRARKAMEGNDPVAIRSAIEFMTGDYWRKGHDDQPEKMMQAIARVMVRGDKRVIEENRSYIRWPDALARYGPPAREYVTSMIEQAKQTAYWSDFRNLALVGGEQAMAYMVETLPRLRRTVEDAGISVDVDVDRMSDIKSRQAVLAYRACRFGIERWAGRAFDTDQQIAQWWEQARDKSQREWLEQSLTQTSLDADHGNAKAQYLLRCMLPDLPNAEDDLPFDPPWQRREGMSYREKAPASYRVNWVKQNQANLVYDELRSCFALRK